MEYTKNYHLPQWAEEDRILMEDFNGAMAAVESGLTAAKATADRAEGLGEASMEVVGGNANCLIDTGSYVGNGQYGSGNAITLKFDFCPVVVIVMDRENANVPVIMMRGCSSANPSTGHALYPVNWGEKTISWYSDNDQYTQCNGANNTYQYVAIGYRNA